MNLHALRLFYTAARYESITKAEAILNISQPAITAQIKALEKSYGVNLFVRKGRNVVLTPLGVQVYNEAEKLFTLEAKIEATLEQRDVIESLRLDGSRLVMNHLLPKRIFEYKQQSPTTQVEIEAHHRDQVIENIRHYRADIGFIGNFESECVLEGLLSFPFTQDPLILVATPSHPFANKLTSRDDLTKTQFYTTKPGSNLRTQFETHFPNHSASVFNDIYELLEYLSLDNNAIALCSKATVQSRLDAKQLIEIQTDFPKPINHISALIRQRDQTTQTIQKFLSFLKING